MDLFGPQGSECSDQEGPLKDPYCGRDHPRVGWQQEVHQVGWNFIIPLHRPRLRVITPPHIQHTWGRYRFIRLPFGLICSQDIFQRMMDQILEHCEGVIGIAEDVVVHGKDDEEHNRRLHNLM